MESNPLALLLVVAGFAFMFGGKKLASKVIGLPFKWAAGLIGDVMHWIVELTLDLLGGLLRGTGRLLNRGIRAILRLPPPAPQRRRQLPRQRRRHTRDDEDEEEDD